MMNNKILLCFAYSLSPNIECILCSRNRDLLLVAQCYVSFSRSLVSQTRLQKQKCSHKDILQGSYKQQKRPSALSNLHRLGQTLELGEVPAKPEHDRSPRSANTQIFGALGKMFTRQVPYNALRDAQCIQALKKKNVASNRKIP